MSVQKRRTVYPQGYELLRKAREAAGLSLAELELETHVNYSRISRIERGDGGDEDTFAALCRALGLRFVPARIEDDLP